MDTRSLMYFYEATKDLNFTRTAARLYISQQDLSNHIARLEREFNCKLFERRPKVALTYAGQCLYDFAQQYRFSEDNIRMVLTEIKEKAEGKLCIGCSPYRTSIVMPILAHRFHDLYPNVHMEFYSYQSDELMKMLINGKLDFSISINRFFNPLFDTDVLFEDSLYLMASRNLLRRHYGDGYAELLPDEGSMADLAVFSELPFLKILSVKLIDDIFMCSGVTPQYAITVTHPPFSRVYLFGDIAACIVTKTLYLHLAESMSGDILFIPLAMPPTMPLHPISFVRNPKKHYSKFSRAFHDLAKHYFSELTDKKIPRCA